MLVRVDFTVPVSRLDYHIVDLVEAHLLVQLMSCSNGFQIHGQSAAFRMLETYLVTTQLDERGLYAPLLPSTVRWRSTDDFITPYSLYFLHHFRVDNLKVS